MKYFYLILVFLLSLTSTAQRLKYKELFPLMPSMSNNELKNSLKEFLNEELDPPNANLGLALVYEKNYKSGNALINYEYEVANAQQPKLPFTKSRKLVDDREGKRNNENYFPVFKRFN